MIAQILAGLHSSSENRWAAEPPMPPLNNGSLTTYKNLQIIVSGDLGDPLKLKYRKRADGGGRTIQLESGMGWGRHNHGDHSRITGRQSGMI